MKAFLAGLGGTVLGALLVVSIGLAANGFITAKLVPRVVDRLERDKYLCDEVAQGRFVATDRDAFAANHRIGADTLLALKRGDFALRDSVDAHLYCLAEDVHNLARSVELVQCDLCGEVPVKVYVSNIEDEADLLVVNELNVAIGRRLLNNREYTVLGSDDASCRLRVVKLALPTPGEPEDAAIGRMHKSRIAELFPGLGDRVPDGVWSVAVLLE